MPVIGPNYSDEQANRATDEILALLKDRYGIQRFPPPKYPDYGKDRIERNKKLNEAIHGLFELESWEAW